MSSRTHKRHMRTLIDTHSGICHYCDVKVDETKSKNPGPNYPTKDHVVPRYLGGPNSMSNYVLACARCNNNRGSVLFFCHCQSCMEIILDFLYDSEALDAAVAGMVQFNRARVRIRGGRYIVDQAGYSRVYDRFEDAIAAANQGIVKDV